MSHRSGNAVPAVGVLSARRDQEVTILPGTLYLGTTAAAAKTLLGSCVAITLWHPGKRIGGMCHYLLPERRRAEGDPLDGRYGVEALHLLAHLIRRHGTRPSEYRVHLYGGADTMPDYLGVKLNVGERNIACAMESLDHYGFELEGVDVGDNVPRNVVIDLRSGDVAMRRGSGAVPRNPAVQP